MEHTDIKAANDHLISVGRQLESARHTADERFYFHDQEGRHFWKPDKDAAWEPLLDAKAETICVSTLTAISDYLIDNPDDLKLHQVLVHVVEPEVVKVISTPLGGHKQRTVHMKAIAVLPEHRFNKHVSPDVFVPYLQSCFCESEDLSALIKIAGNIVDTSEIQSLDDGVSQTVSIRQGAARKAEVEVPSPAILFPFSTFAEVVQPPRKFVFRLNSAPLNCQLIEADGGAWKLAAIESIAKWFKEKIPSDVKVIA